MVLLECGKNRRVKMFRLSPAIAVGHDVHGLLMVECRFIGPLAAQSIVNGSDSFDFSKT